MAINWSQACPQSRLIPILSCAQEDIEGSRHISRLTDGWMSHVWQFLLSHGSVLWPSGASACDMSENLLEVSLWEESFSCHLCQLPCPGWMHGVHKCTRTVKDVKHIWENPRHRAGSSASVHWWGDGGWECQGLCDLSWESPQKERGS